MMSWNAWFPRTHSPMIERRSSPGSRDRSSCEIFEKLCSHRSSSSSSSGVIFVAATSVASDSSSARTMKASCSSSREIVRTRTISRDELHEAFMVRAELESLATEVAATKITPEELDELDRCEQRFSKISQELRSREPGDGRRSIMGDWVRQNHAFHDIIYRVAGLPLVEQMAKSARRTFSGPAVWAPGDHSIDGLYLKNAEQHRAIKQALAAGSAAGARALAREHVLSSFTLLETILEQVGAQPRDWQRARGARSRS